MRGAAESIHDAVVCRRVRRWAAVLMLAWGSAELVAQWPGAGRFGRYLPLVASGQRPVVAVSAAIGLMAAGRGIRRGQRDALIVGFGALVIGGLCLAVKQQPLSGATFAVAGILLARARGCFSAQADLRSARAGLAIALVGLPVAIALDTLDSPAVHSMSALLGVVTSVVAGWLLSRPQVVSVPAAVPNGVSLLRARRLIKEHGSDPLAYFALRDDKFRFFHGESMVAYAVVRGVCVVSPDPIGPVQEREEVWTAFRKSMDAQGWIVGVLGAGDEWLSIYRESGMRAVYIGDEAVVHCPSFQLAGRRFKSLRQAVQRVAKRGHTVEIYDPLEVPGELRHQIAELVVKGRLGGCERGFSMTLGRLFSPDDLGLLLAVCFDPDGEPVACCQFVPTQGGYCLDLMRRDPAARHGVVDMILVKAIEVFSDAGVENLGLNFSAWRAVLAGERPNSLKERAFRWNLRQLSRTFQIESLWQFNKKYDPEWLRRYAAYSGVEDFVPSLLGVAKVESYWELPLIGRFMLPPDVALWKRTDDHEASEIDLREHAEPELLMAEQA